MRQSDKSRDMQSIASAQISNFKDYCSCENAEKYFSNLLHAWVGGEIIEMMQRPERQNVLQFHEELKSLVISILDDQLLSDQIAINFLLRFYEKWSNVTINEILKDLTDSFFMSDIANDKDSRCGGYEFLKKLNNLLLPKLEIVT